MDVANSDNLEQEKKNEEPLNYHSPNMSSEWQINAANLAGSSMGLIPQSNPMAVCKGDMIDSSSCSSASMVGSFCPTVWDQPSSSQNLGFCDINVRQNASTSHPFGTRTTGMGPLGAAMDRPLDMGWNPPSAMLRGGMFLPAVPGMLPQSLAQIPADSGFIDRAARFSSFSGGNFGDMMNPFSMPEPVNPYFRGVAPIQRPQEFSAGDGLKSIPSVQSQTNEMNMAANPKDGSLRVDHGATERSPLKNEKRSESLPRSQDEVKQGAGASEKESDDAGFSGRSGQEELDGADGESSAKGFSSKKRKRIGQDADEDENRGAPEPSTEATKNHTATQQKEDQNTTSTTTKLGGKNGKQGPQTSDPTKEDYIHVRARRGQATNSHSLAERVRREKISERMKFLQDLVPGCSKVTGKAVMLDEIINYVQSLQRQVEFLSMKLATINPRLNFNIESLLAKDILQSRAGPSSSLAFLPDMAMQYPALHPQPPGLIQVGLPGLESSSDAFRRSIISQFTNAAGGYKEPTSHVPGAWEDELHNVVQMSLNSIAPVSSQDLSASLPPRHMKPEQ